MNSWLNTARVSLKRGKPASAFREGDDRHRLYRCSVVSDRRAVLVHLISINPKAVNEIRDVYFDHVAPGHGSLAPIEFQARSPMIKMSSVVRSRRAEISLPLPCY